MTIEAMKQALDALETHAAIGVRADKAIATLRQAIAEAKKQKPLTDEMAKQMKERYYDLEMRGAFADGWINAEAAHGIKGKAMGIMRKAIAEAEKQEPVAWVQDVEFEQLPEFAFSWVKTRLHDKPLYTHPPKREWVGLTDEEAAECWNSSAVTTWKNIEAKLREKNGC